MKRKKDLNKSREGGLEIHWLQGSKAGKSEGGSREGARSKGSKGEKRVNYRGTKCGVSRTADGQTLLQKHGGERMREKEEVK